MRLGCNVCVYVNGGKAGLLKLVLGASRLLNRKAGP